MAQGDFRNDIGATYVAIESSFGTTPSMTRVYTRSGVTVTPTTSILARQTQQTKTYARDKSDRGYQSAQAAFTCDWWIDNTRLTSAGSASTTWLGAILKALMGGESAAAGSTFAAGSSTSSIVAATGHGPRFPVGTVFLADVADVPEVVISKAVSTDTITPLFNLSASPTTGQDLINCHCYYLTDTNAQSLTLQHALAQDSSHQWTCNGGTGGFSLDLSRDAQMSFAFDLAFAKHAGPSSQSISTATGSNALSGPMVNNDAVCLLQSLSTTTRVHVPFQSLSLSVELGNQHVEELGGSTEGRVGVMRKGAVSVTAQLTMRSDPAQYTGWDSDEDLVLVYAVPMGSGATKRWAGFVLYCNREERPARGADGMQEMTVLNLRGRQNTMQSTATTDLALSPLVLFEG